MTSEAHEKTRIRQLEDAAAHWEHKYANARQYNRNLEARNTALEAALGEAIEYVSLDSEIPNIVHEWQAVLDSESPPPSPAYTGSVTDSIDIEPPCGTSETVKEYDPGPPDCPHGYWKAHCAVCGQSETSGVKP